MAKDKDRSEEGRRHLEELAGMRMPGAWSALLMSPPITAPEQQVLPGNTICFMDANGNMPTSLSAYEPRENAVVPGKVLLEISLKHFEAGNQSDLHYVSPTYTLMYGLEEMGLMFRDYRIGALCQMMDDSGAYEQHGIIVSLDRSDYRDIAKQMLEKLAPRDAHAAQALGYDDPEAMSAALARPPVRDAIASLVVHAGMEKQELERLKKVASRTDNLEFLAAAAKAEAVIMGSLPPKGSGFDKMPGAGS